MDEKYGESSNGAERVDEHARGITCMDQFMISFHVLSVVHETIQ